MGPLTAGRRAMTARMLIGSESAAPALASTDFLLQWGRALSAFWNAQGPNTPEQGRRYQTWWRQKFLDLDRPWQGGALAKFSEFAEDTSETLQLYQSEAAAWYDANPQTRDPSHPPPKIQPADLLESIEGALQPIADTTKWIAVLALTGVGLYGLSRVRR